MYCTTVVDDCDPNPCKNGGTCVDGIGSFICNCKDGFKGLTCQFGKCPHCHNYESLL